MKVYIATNGEYSDKEIVGVFSSSEKAWDYARTFDDPRVEEWDVDNKKPDERVKVWFVAIKSDTGDEAAEPYSKWMKKRPESEYGANRPLEGLIRATSIRSLEHARKLAAEKRQHFLRTRDSAITRESSRDADPQS